jgi:Fe-S oxidoreductase/nitrate reductase gamma subunit
MEKIMIEPSREIFWNIPYYYILYVVAVLVVAVMVWSIYRRFRMWNLGKPDPRLKGNLGRRWKAFLKAVVIDIIFHWKFMGIANNIGHRPYQLRDIIPREWYPGVTHFLLAIGCILLLIGTAMDIVSHYGYEFILGNVYFAHSLFSDIGGIMALIGVIMAVIRRYIQRPQRLDNKREDLIALLAIAIIVVSGYVVEGLRIAADEITTHPVWSYWSPGGYILAEVFRNFSNGSLLIAHRTMWWIHSFLTLGFLVYIAFYFNRLWHIVLSPLNVFWRNLEPRGAMTPIDLEKTESYGVSKVENFTWKHLLDLDACSRCGRCQDNCPANISGKPLNPKKVIQDIKTHWLEKAPSLLASKALVGEKLTSAQTLADGGISTAIDSKPLIGGVIDIDSIWNCTTCYACQEVCPVWAEPMLKISEMRRNLVMEQAKIPETAEGALRSIEDRGHPWRGTMLERTSWFENLDIKPLSEDSNVDILYWVGCTEALEDRSFKVAQATGKLFKMAGVKFGVLGIEESCCGDPARRLGNEYLYQMQVQNNIGILKNYNVKKIVTGCPHCFNSLKNEYRQFGGNFEVIHHSDFLLQLLKSGALKINVGLKGRLTYHDPCYLGRYNNVFDAPRELLRYLPDLKLVEMNRNRERNFCCGAGGGHMWLEEQKVGERINVMRTTQAIETKANIVATACPYCLQMFQDGIKTRAVEETLKVMDIAEILAESAVFHPV